jgi:general secretion pathway protein G
MNLKTSKTGFTLIELMIVVIIIAALAAMVAPSLINRSDEAKENIVRGDLSSIDTALKLFRLDTGAYPASEQGLDSLLAETGKGPYLEKKAVDPWKNAYRYKCPGVHRTGSFDVYSVGRDGKEGTADDIGNWQ